MPLCTMSAASSAPAPAESSDTTMMSDDVSRRDRLVDDERPSCGSQNRLPSGGNSNDGSRGQCDHH
jgi:hypothetical protein